MLHMGSMRYALLRFFAVLLLVAPVLAAELEVVDGDTFRLDQVTIRIENIDAPETRDAKCAAERLLGEQAKRRLEQLLFSGELTLTRNPDDGRDADRYGRKLRRVAVDGVDAGETLVSEGLARRWDGRRHRWC